ncbi:MAG: hypothetical protein XE11_0073 [Methanomicrobiales archaeon 53_19]|jgi:outer membrane biogenesis lipoprotein LolB|uniref:hypothetical protein n=1 Tax=Methanocalculus sp. TaxID=2004547 RepID=UPI000748DB18|nr:hypothetical protein [Methanocalculus sp.]KUK70564.1 MAG: hypothetical protein XD88_0575 [Methanocalculus sp. 52_23]KUL05211.1 MAG: hypothetical protein XE11_0073 [Methanomicrobiales archaeon 53_19]HIJ05786.1 hypothetical protein [Methanocalculus sp.]
MKRYLICISLLLLLTAGCVSEAEPAAPADPLTGVWVHDSGNPVFLFEFSPSGSVNIVFMSIEDPGRPGYADVVTGRWEESPDSLAITYTAPLSGNVVTLHLERSGTFLVLTGATTADGSVLDIQELEGIRFIRGESYSDPMMGDYQVDIL